MAIIISHESAREYYRLAHANVVRMPSQYEGDPRPKAVGGPKRAGGSIISRDGLSVRELEAHCLYPMPDWLHARRDISDDEWREIIGFLAQHDASGYQLAKPLDILLLHQGARGKDPLIRAHVWTSELPPNSFRQISQGLFIVSPELLYLQTAQREQSLHAIATFGCEIAGAYSLLPRGLVTMRKQLDGRNPLDPSWITPQHLLEADGYVDCKPRTTIKKLESFLEAMPPHVRGIKRALQALRWVKEASRSPMETGSSLQLRTSRAWGGFRVGDANFNVKVPIKREWQKILNKPYLVADELFVGSNGKVADVEYNGAGGHSSKEQVMADNLRRRALVDEGIRVFFVTARDFYDMRSWEMLGEELAHYLGKRMDPPSPAMLERRQRMHADLTDPNFLK